MAYESVTKLKPRYRKGLWSPEEDEKLRNHILRHGHSCWSTVPVKAGLQRNGKSCRLRWINYLRPGLKRGLFTPEEEETIFFVHRLLGNKWSQIAQHLPGRTDNEIKNYWNSHLKKKVIKVGEGLEAQTDTSYINLTPEITESKPIPNGSTSRVPSFESLIEHMEGSLTDTNQSNTPHQVLEFSPPGEETHKSFLPRLLFADWLPSDDVQGSNFVHSAEQNAKDSDFSNSLGQGCLQSETLFAYGFDHGLSSNATCGNFPPHCKFENQVLTSGFIDFDSIGEMYSDFNMPNNEIYL